MTEHAVVRGATLAAHSRLMTLNEALHHNVELGAQVQRFEGELKVAQLPDLYPGAHRRAPINRIDELLPWVVAPQLQAAWEARAGRSGPEGLHALRNPPRRTAGGSRYDAATSTTSAPLDTQDWQLCVELEDVRPKVWRRLLVPLTIGTRSRSGRSRSISG